MRRWRNGILLRLLVRRPDRHDGGRVRDLLLALPEHDLHLVLPDPLEALLLAEHTLDLRLALHVGWAFRFVDARIELFLPDPFRAQAIEALVVRASGEKGLKDEDRRGR